MAFLGQLLISDSNKLLPTGEYDAIIKSCDIVQSKKNPEHTNIKIIWSVLDSKFKEHQLFDYVVHTHSNTDAVEAGHKKLAKILKINRIDPEKPDLDTNDFINLEAKLQVNLEQPNQSMSVEHNQIIGYIDAIKIINTNVHAQQVDSNSSNQPSTINKAPWAKG